jgi:hypothetical protein
VSAVALARLLLPDPPAAAAPQPVPVIEQVAS